VLSCWSADEIMVSSTVPTARLSTVLAAAEALMPELPEAANVLITVQRRPDRSSSCTAEKYRNQAGQRRTSMDDQFKPGQSFQTWFDVSPRWHAEGLRYCHDQS
jgi:hypothetical protein